MPKRKPRNLPQPAWDYAVCIHGAGGSLIVVAESLLSAAWLIEAGYARAENDYDGPRIMLNDSGNKLISD